MLAMSNQYDDNIINLMVWLAIIGALALYFRRRRVSSTAFGSAEFASDKLLRRWGMLGGRGLVLGRTIKGELIRLPRYCHGLLVGGPGSGKSSGFLMANLLDYRGSVIVFDPKRDLRRNSAGRRKRMGRVVRLDPFGEGGDLWNVLDTIPADSPLLIEEAGAMAESLVVRAGSNEPFWDDRASQVIKAVLVFVLLRLRKEERNLNSVQDIASDPVMLAGVGGKLREIGGVAGRGGNVIKGLFDASGRLTKEGTGVHSSVSRHLSFLDSDAVAKSLSASTWEVGSLLEPGTTLFLTIPTSQLEASKGLLRLWVSTLIRFLGSSSSEEENEVLLMLDEASNLNGLAAVEQALTMGRSAGCRCFLAYQSDAQIQTAFGEAKKSLLYDNCSTQIYLKVSSIETAERLSKSLGDWTQQVEGSGDNWGGSRSSGGNGGGSGSVSWGGSTSRSLQGRALMRPEEILNQAGDFLLALIGDLPSPVLARNLKWYEDPAFGGRAPRPPAKWNAGMKGACCVAAVVILICALVSLATWEQGGTHGTAGLAPPSTVGPTPPAPKELVPVPKLGLELEPAVSPEQAAFLGLAAPAGALVIRAGAGGPARAAGVIPLDVVLAVDGVAVGSAADLRSRVEAVPPGFGVRLTIWRGWRAGFVDVVVGAGAGGGRDGAGVRPGAR